MQLADLTEGRVFVDTSILIYAFTETHYTKTCEDFLGRAKYGLLFSDALHAACCKVYGITNIATNDADFERVDFLKIWKP